MKIVRKTSVTPEIPTASMADIAFLLIIFFMVTAVFSASKGLELSLNREEPPEGQPAPQDAIFIKVLPDGTVMVDCRAMAVDAIPDYVRPRLAHDPEKPVVFYTAPDAPFQAMIAVYDALAGGEGPQGFRVENVSIPTHREIEEYVRLFGYDPFESACKATAAMAKP